jgi:hypothetical protein
MRCVDLNDQLSAYADGQTGQAQTEALETHLTSCERCRRVLARYRQTGSILALAREDNWTPPDLRLRIMLASQQPQRQRLAVWRPVISACVAAVALLGAVLGAHALAPASVATPAAQPQQVVASALPVSSTPHVVHAASVAGCPQHSILAIARCLGVSRTLVPIILMEERDARSSSHTQRNHLSTAPRSSLTTASTAPGTTGLKGGGARGLNSMGHRGMQAI